LLDSSPLQKLITSACLYHCTNVTLFPHALQCPSVYMRPEFLLYQLF